LLFIFKRKLAEDFKGNFISDKVFYNKERYL